MLKLLAVLCAGWILLPLLDSLIGILAILIVAALAMRERPKDW